jgi:hypothetical protein
MAECSRHPGNTLPGCHWCRTGTEPPSRPADVHMAPLYQAQLLAAESMVRDMQDRINAMADSLRAKGFEVTNEGGDVVVRWPEDTGTDPQP